MATDVERLVVSMEAKLSKFDRDLRKAVGMSDRTARSIESRFSRMEKRISTTGASLARGLIAPLAGALAAREILGMADAYTRLTNSLKFAGVPANQVSVVMDRLLAVANKSGTSIERVAGLFARLSGVQKEVKASTDEMYQATENISLIMGASGADASTMSAAMLQLGQAFGSATVQAEEFNPLMDTARPILQAAANAIEEAGGSVSKLQRLVKDGKLSGEAFFRAILNGSRDMATKAAAAPQTFAQRLVVLRNELTNVVGRMNDTTGATGGMNAALDRLTAIIKDPDFQQGLATIAGGIAGIAAAAASLVRDAQGAIEWLGRMRREADAWLERNRFASPGGITFPGDSIAGAIARQKQLNNPLGGLSAGPAVYETQRGIGGGTYNSKFTPAPLSALGAAPTGKTSGSKSSEKDPWETIWGLGLGREQAAEAAAKAQEELNKKIDEGKQAATDFLQTFVGGMMEGKSATDAASDAFKGLSTMLMDKALEQAVSQIFGMFTGALGGAPVAPPGGYTGLIPTSFGGFRAAGGPVSAGKGYVVGENGPELFVPRASGSISPNGGAPVIEISVRRGEMFEPVVSQISGSQADIRIRRNNDAMASARRHGVKGI